MRYGEAGGRGATRHDEGDDGLVAELLEAAMLVCFGLSWPLNAYKNYKAGTAAGSSWQFIALITAGYVAGIAAKFVSGSVNSVSYTHLDVYKRQALTSATAAPAALRF